MLTACIKSEQLKVKKSLIRIAFVLTPLIPAVMGAQNYLNNLDILTETWFSLWTQETLFYSNFFFAPLIAIYCSYLWRLENRNKNRNLLMTMPVPVRDIFLGKLFVIGQIVAFTQVWVYVLFIATGKLLGFEGLPPIATLFYIVRGFLGGMTIAALQLLCSMLIQSFALPVAVAILGSVTGLVAASSPLSVFYPYSLMMLGMNANRSENMLEGSGLTFLFSACFYLILFIGAATWILKRQDVRA